MNNFSVSAMKMCQMLSWKRLCCFMGRYLTPEPRPANMLFLLCNISQGKVQVLPDADSVLPYIQPQEKHSHVITDLLTPVSYL